LLKKRNFLHWMSTDIKRMAWVGFVLSVLIPLMTVVVCGSGGGGGGGEVGRVRGYRGFERHGLGEEGGLGMEMNRRFVEGDRVEWSDEVVENRRNSGGMLDFVTENYNSEGTEASVCVSNGRLYLDFTGKCLVSPQTPLFLNSSHSQPNLIQSKRLIFDFLIDMREI
jgi:hypothetical protein